MAKQAEVVVPTFLEAFNRAAYEARYKAALAKPAFGRITDVPGYEGVLWGGELAWNIGSNFSRLYMNYCIAYAIEEKYTPSRPGMGVAGILKEARAAGVFGPDLPEMNRSDWRAVLENHPQEDTEGGVGLSMAKLLDLLQGFSDNENNRKTKALADLRDTMLAIVDLLPDYEQFRRRTQQKETASDTYVGSVASGYQRAKAQAQVPVAAAG